MPNSHADPTTLICRSCSRDFQAEIWWIVDTEERPDLFEQIQKGRLHVLDCPYCKSENPVDAPLLIYQLGIEPNLVFSPQKKTGEELDREIAVILLQLLSQSIGGTWQDEWVKGMAVLAKPALPDLFTQDLGAAQAFDQNIKAGQEPSEEETRQLVELIFKFMEADSWGETRRVLVAHPELLTDYALLVLDFLIDQAQEEPDQDAERIFR